MKPFFLHVKLSKTIEFLTFKHRAMKKSEPKRKSQQMVQRNNLKSGGN